MAIVTVPAFVVGLGLCAAIEPLLGELATPDGYSPLSQVVAGAWCALLLALAAAGGRGLLVERYAVSPTRATAAVLAWWLGTNVLYYVAFDPLISHVLGATVALLYARLLHHADPDTQQRSTPAWTAAQVGAAYGLLVTIRPTNVLLGLPLLWVLWRDRSMRSAAAAALGAAVPLTVGVAAYVAANLDAFLGLTQPAGYDEEERFLWTRPAVLRILFSSRNGLFFWSPILLLAAIGIARHLASRRDGLLWAWVVSAALLVYVNASWYAWWFGDGFGARSFIVLAPLWLMGLGLFLQQTRRRGHARAAAVAMVVLAGVSLALMALRVTKVLPAGEYLLPFERRTMNGPWERI